MPGPRAIHVHQKITMMINRYEIFIDNAGVPGDLIAFVEQKRFKFKEQVTIYTDSSKSRVLAEFNARRVLDVGSEYDVTDEQQRPIGLFRKDFGKSLLRSTWHVEQPGWGAATGAERSQGIAIFRRVWNFLPWISDWPFPIRYHFDFVTPNGTPAFSVDKKTWVRDHYLVSILDPALDVRLVIAQAVALDALQSR
ncbi:hypothetical protein Lesp02_46320 [Lentzea sp. NBRC 105346]|nr:hypothetical protein Lesp02_46320 [Lentzea sp. NBRC 105346]